MLLVRRKIKTTTDWSIKAEIYLRYLGIKMEKSVWVEQSHSDKIRVGNIAFEETNEARSANNWSNYDGKTGNDSKIIRYSKTGIH